MERIHVALQDDSTSLNGSSGERIRPNDRSPVFSWPQRLALTTDHIAEEPLDECP
jgi:hypothetical protein